MRQRGTVPMVSTMLNFKKILLPLDLEESELPAAVIRQASFLARRFQGEILVLHVIRPLTYLAGSETARALEEQAVAEQQERWNTRLGPELEGISVRRKLVHGDPAREILSVAQQEAVGLILMPAHSYGAYQRLLVGSVTAKVIHHSRCPVWACAQPQDANGKPFEIHNVFCAVDLSDHSLRTIERAKDVAAEFGARLTIAHATPGVEIYGPGGSHVIPELRDELVAGAKERIACLQQDAGTNADVFIGCGDPSKVIRQGAQEKNANLIVVGMRYHNGRLGTNAYGIIREAHIPVLSV